MSGPVIILLNETNPSARYVGLSLLTFSFPVSCMGLIILPKALLVRKIQRLGGSDENPTTSLRSTPSAGVFASAEGEIANPVAAASPVVGSELPTERLGPKIQVVTFE